MIGRFPTLAAGATEVASLAVGTFAAQNLDRIVLLAPPTFPADVGVFGATAAAALSLPLVTASLVADPGGALKVVIEPDSVWLGTRVLVVSPAVETGRSARLLATALRSAGAAWLGLVTAVCPREAEPMLREAYDQIEGVVHPFVRRSASWHFTGLSRGSA